MDGCPRGACEHVLEMHEWEDCVYCEKEGTWVSCDVCEELYCGKCDCPDANPRYDSPTNVLPQNQKKRLSSLLYGPDHPDAEQARSTRERKIYTSRPIKDAPDHLVRSLKKALRHNSQSVWMRRSVKEPKNITNPAFG